jgi:hypothetical protein
LAVEIALSTSKSSARDGLAGSKSIANNAPTPRVAAFHRGGSLAIGLVLPSLVESVLDERDPRRFYIAQVLPYGGTFIIAAPVWLRHR